MHALGITAGAFDGLDCDNAGALVHELADVSYEEHTSLAGYFHQDFAMTMSLFDSSFFD